MTISSKKEEQKKQYPPEVVERFDGMLDLISAKNAKIGRLTVELAESKETFENLLNATMEPEYKRIIRLRIGALDRFLKEAFQ